MFVSFGEFSKFNHDILYEASTVVTCLADTATGPKDKYLQGGPAKVRPTYIFDGNIWMHR